MMRLFSFLLVLALSAGSALAQFTDQRTWAGAASGTNTITITIANWSANLPGVPLRFIPAASNTGAATLNVSGLGAVAINKRSSSGLLALTGGELIINQMATATYDGTVFVLDAAPRITQTPTIQTLCASASCTTNAASGTYTTPAGVAWLTVQACAGGGGGGGQGSGTGGTGGTTTWTIPGPTNITAIGGSGGAPGGGSNGIGLGGIGGTGGTGTVNYRIPGVAGEGGVMSVGATGTSSPASGPGGSGGNSAFWGGGGAGTNSTAVAGVTLTGGGGGGAAGVSANSGAAGGGGGGECFYLVIGTPAATYSWVAGAAGTTSASGALGGSGRLIVEEHYNYLLDPANDNQPMFLNKVA